MGGDAHGAVEASEVAASSSCAVLAAEPVKATSEDTSLARTILGLRLRGTNRRIDPYGPHPTNCVAVHGKR